MTRSIYACLALALVGCGDNQALVCAPGTFPNGTSCSTFDPDDTTAPVTTASPTEGRTRALPGFVMLSSDEPATIFFTTDGSDPASAAGEPSPAIIPALISGTTIKFYAIDAAGNQEAPREVTYIEDTTPPAPVANLTITPSGSTAMVSWTNPTDADYAGTLLVRVTSLADAAPLAGEMYAAPGELSPSMPILIAGTENQHSDTGLSGAVRYAAWAYDDLGNYSRPVFVQAEIGTFTTTATFTYDVTGQTLTLTQAPTGLDLTATTAEHSVATLTLHLSIKNLTTHYFQNPKVLVTSVTNGVFTGPDGTADGSPFASIGPGFFAPAAIKTKDLVFIDAAPGTTVTIELDLGDHASLLGTWQKQCCNAKPHRVLDVGSGIARTAFLFSTGGRSSSRLGGISRPGVLIAGRYLDIPTSEGSIERWDMVTETRVGGVSLGVGQRHSVMALLAGNGVEYAIMKTGGMRNAGKVATVVRLDETLRQTGLLDLQARHGKGMTTAALSPDGATIAIPAELEIVLIDTTTLQLKDADPTTPEIDSIVSGLQNDDRVRDVAFFNDSSGLVAIGRSGGISIIKLTATGYTVTAEAKGSRGNAVLTMPDGRVWIGTDTTGLWIYNPADNSLTESAYPAAGGARALAYVDGQLWVLQSNRTTINQVDSTGAIERIATMSQPTYSHWLMTTR